MSQFRPDQNYLFREKQFLHFCIEQRRRKHSANYITKTVSDSTGHHFFRFTSTLQLRHTSTNDEDPFDLSFQSTKNLTVHDKSAHETSKFVFNDIKLVVLSPEEINENWLRNKSLTWSRTSKKKCIRNAKPDNSDSSLMRSNVRKFDRAGSTKPKIKNHKQDRDTIIVHSSDSENMDTISLYASSLS